MNKKIYLLFLILCFVSASGVLGVRAQTDGGDKILAAGENPVKKSDVEALIEFYEWVFALEFSDSRREDFRRVTENEFRADPQGARRGTDALVAEFAKIKALDPAVRERKRRKFAPEFIASMRKMSNDPTARLVVAVYDEANAASQSADVSNAIAEPDNSENSAGGSFSDFAGKWVWGRSGSSTYSTGGSYMGGNGSRFTYQFSPGGAVEYTGIMNVMTAGCNMQVFTSKKGRASLNGDTLTIAWAPAAFSRDDSCSPSKNYKKTLPAETETFRVKFKNSYGQRQLCLTGKDETCFSPAD